MGDWTKGRRDEGAPERKRRGEGEMGRRGDGTTERWDDGPEDGTTGRGND